jgi:colicin import membrane protein
MRLRHPMPPGMLWLRRPAIELVMPRKLKTYQTSLGFYDLAVAAPSMKAALEAWGAGSNLFHQGFAQETDDPEVIAATLAQPGVVLKRPAGSRGRFAEQAGLPADLADKDGGNKGRRSKVRKSRPAAKVSEKEARKAAAEFEREQRRQDTERRREAAATEKERARREDLVAKAQAALDKAQREHEERSETLLAERAAIEERIEAEDARWESERQRLTKALRRARD